MLNVPVDCVQRPKNFLPLLTRQGVQRELSLGLVKTKSVRHAHRQPFILQEAEIIRLEEAVNLSED